MTRDALAERYGIEFERFAGISLESRRPSTATSSGPPARRLLRHPQGRADARGPCRGRLLGIGDSREDSQTRAGAAKFGWDKRFGLWKLNPLADWTEAEVWDYINEHECPTTPFTTRATLDRMHATAPARRGDGATHAPVAGPTPTGPSAASMGRTRLTRMALDL